MRPSTILAPLFVFAATTSAQAVEEGIAPASSPPSGCRTTVEGTFEIGTLENPSLKGKRETAQQAADGALACTLKDGVLHDSYGRTGSVVANRQFQFDGPPQAGAIYTGGFSVCGNNSLAIGGTTRWWRCMSGSFGNLYDEWIGAQCHEIRIQAIFPLASSSLLISASTVMASDMAGVSPTASASIASSGSASNASQTGATASSGASVFSTASAFTTTPTASGTAASSGSGTAAAAPPAQTGAATSPSIASGAVMAMVAAAAALVL